MMKFYAAAGSYQLIAENGHKLPYILRLGKLHPISIPEFVVWSSLLCEVMSYEEARKAYQTIMQGDLKRVPPFDEILAMLTKRKLVVEGAGYTGLDALYQMLANAYVIPMRTSMKEQRRLAFKLFSQGKIGLRRLIDSLRQERLDANQRRVLRLVEQNPLSSAELIRCFDEGITDVSSADRLVESIYPTEESSQARLQKESMVSQNATTVLQAVADLYLNRRVILETA